MSTPTTTTDPAVIALLADVASGETPRPASDLRRLPALRRPDGRVRDVGFIYRAFLHGVRNVNGDRIKLPYIVGPSGAKISTQSAVNRWIGAINGINTPPTKQTASAHNDAKRRLSAAGLT